MKIYHFICICLLVLCNHAIVAQHRCMTDEYHQEHLQNDSKYAKHYNQLISMPKSNSKSRQATCQSIITIPIAVHFNDPIDCSNKSCLLDIVESQIDVLNEDFLASNTDYQDYIDLNEACPSAYPLSTAPVQNEGACVQFCLARKNHPDASGLTDGDPAITVGINDWPSAPDWDGYLNIFVSGSESGLGISPLPGSANGDGFWVKNTSFGGPGMNCNSGGDLNSSNNYNLGRTSTHEAGHFLGLPHVFGSVCSQDPDSNPPGPISIEDTPSQINPFFGTDTVDDCSDVPEDCTDTPSNFFSFMDYTNDSHMVIFTADQMDVINWHADNIPFNSNTTYCEGSYGIINCVTAPSCFDELQNQDEQDIDCGGIYCSDCSSYCGKDFFDPGGPNSNYLTDMFSSWTFCPDNPDEMISITFNEWDVENHSMCNWDEMIIYDGNSSEATQLGSWCTISPGTVMASNPSGCLHITFNSDFSVVESGWKAIISCSALIPVELSSFIGSHIGQGNLLKWTTEIEIQNKGFSIQRSNDGKNFTDIGFIDGQGDTHERVEYEFLDSNIENSEDYYYRLKQLDFNGNHEYSNIIHLDSVNHELSGISMYPNPVSGERLNVHISKSYENVSLRLFNLDGKLLLTRKASYSDNQIDLGGIPPGVYLLQAESNSQLIETKKLIKV